MASRTLIVDETPLIREGLVAAVSALRTLSVVDQGASLADAVRLCQMRSPDVLILGFSRSEDPVPTISQIIASAPELTLVSLVPVGREGDVPSLLRSGARGCVSIMTRPAELVRCLEMSMSGTSYVSPGLAARVLMHAPQKPAPAKPPRRAVLTQREQEILELVASGESNRSIAARLELSEKTVKRYMTFIMQKINVKNRLQAALYLNGQDGG